MHFLSTYWATGFKTAATKPRWTTMENSLYDTTVPVLAVNSMICS